MNPATAIIPERLRQRFEQYRELAEETGDKEAQFWTGHCYDCGRGVECNKDQAAEWYQRAADQQSGKAMYELGMCYRLGRGVVQDDGKAEKLLEASIPLLKSEAQSEDTEAMFVLAMAYLDGANGVEDNDQHVLQWIERAAELNHPNSQSWLGYWYERGMLGLRRNEKLAVELYHRAASEGDEGGQASLGRCYQYGIGVPAVDLVQSLYWYQQAAETNGSNWAQNNFTAITREIARKRNRLISLVQTSLSKTTLSAATESPSSTSYSLGLWGRGLASLAAPQNQPAGSSPAFLLLRELTPQVIEN